MSNPLSLLNLIVTICLTIGGIAAYHHGFTRTVNEVQERVINALQKEIEALHIRISALEKENTRLGYTITTICAALKKRGIHVTIDGDIVSIYDCGGEGSTYNAHIQNSEDDATQEKSEAASPKATSRRASKKRSTALAEEQP